MGFIKYLKQNVYYTKFRKCLQKHKLIAILVSNNVEIASKYEGIAKRSAEVSLPTVLRKGPYRFYWYSHEPGEPPHVHVDKDLLTAKYWLDSVRLARNNGFPPHQLRRIRSIIEGNQLTLLEAWYGYFGT